MGGGGRKKRKIEIVDNNVGRVVFIEEGQEGNTSGGGDSQAPKNRQQGSKNGKKKTWIRLKAFRAYFYPKGGEKNRPSGKKKVDEEKSKERGPEDRIRMAEGLTFSPSSKVPSAVEDASSMSS